MKVLNLYAGIGGNRALWPDYFRVTAVEYDEKIAAVYRHLFPLDEVIVTDAHQYLLKHFKEYDLIWSSPPCPTHSVTNNFLHVQGVIRYPEMGLYQEIIFLKKWFKGIWIVENVNPYYKPLIPAVSVGRHLYWSNFHIEPVKRHNKISVTNARGSTRRTTSEHLEELQNFYGIDLRDLDLTSTFKYKVLSNCVDPKTGKYIIDQAFTPGLEQLGIF